MNRKYISVRYDAETQAKLRRWAEDHGYDLYRDWDGSVTEDPMDFHTTVMYSKNAMNIHDMDYMIVPMEVSVKGMAWYTPTTPVLEISSSFLSQKHAAWANYGLIHSYPEFKPHVSIAYCTDMRTLPPNLPDFPLRFDRVVIKNIKE